MIEYPVWARFFIVLVLLQAGLAWGMHEADHRYRVSGYVRDDLGKPKSDVAVLLEHKETNQKKKVKTDWLGYYEHIFHLHNHNLDDVITVTVGSDVKTHQVKFDPKDGVTDRSGTVDFGAPAADSGKVWIYGGAGVGGALLIALYFYMSGKKAKTGKKQKHRDRHGK